jgi:hypothetical protein
VVAQRVGLVRLQRRRDGELVGRVAVENVDQLLLFNRTWKCTVRTNIRPKLCRP